MNYYYDNRFWDSHKRSVGARYHAEVLWCCRQFKAMGASKDELDEEYGRMMEDLGYLMYCQDLLDFESHFI